MITVNYSEQNEERHFSCIGHSGYNVGNDIVCAAVSALCGALAATLFINEDSFEALTVAEGEGECLILCEGSAAAPYFSLVLNGLYAIADAYPFNLRVTGHKRADS